ncbi:MAG: coenzyme F420-0:L-glutamate ligase, partial [Clostridia bacterium]|nr:coenzyme F420-0:L-glutamate ligase [Clostridia bacterium]
MGRMIGTVSRGVRAPIIRNGDDIVKIVTESILTASKEENIPLRDRDVVAMTEAVVARAQGNYATVTDIADDIKAKFGNDATIGVIFPILSRNRFAICLRGIAMGAKKVVIMLSYPSDEVGNHLVSMDMVDEKDVDPYKDVLTLEQYRELFGYEVHPFTGVDYVAYYEKLVKECGAEVEIIFANNPKAILSYTKNVLCCDIHTRARTKRILKKSGGEIILGLDDILSTSINGSGFNAEYGLLGSNKATEDQVKLFPRDCQEVVDAIQRELKIKSGKNIEVMVYGDGAFKDPVGKIWELADPVVSP